MTARSLMVQGVGSDVGKSLLVAGLCRVFTRMGYRVLPFKPQNMSNNAAVADLDDGAGGGEIGRAQALQARACGVRPSVHMNPVLLKPQTDMGSQIIVQGRVFGQAKARDYYDLKPQLLPKVLESFNRLKADADLVLVEGAGSPAEINLRAGDIANMGFAEAADVPVALVADIDRGGVIASLHGTVDLLEPSERARLVGYFVNKFRGDKTLFDSAVEILTQKTGLRNFGVIPWFSGAALLPAEDAMALEKQTVSNESALSSIRIAVPRLGRIANFDDLDPLRSEPDVEVVMVPSGEPLPGDADLVLLPGSKTTISDLSALRKQGWDIDLAAHVRRGGHVLGLCAGYQMLGETLSDPDGVEGPPGDVAGLGLLRVDTVIGAAKSLRERSAVEISTGNPVSGYEMHMGRTTGAGTDRPMVRFADTGEEDGAVSTDGRIMGSYMHGIFSDDAFRRAYLARFRANREEGPAYEQQVEQTLDALADHLQTHADIDAITAAFR
ncbi:MAG: cobyric acid synthase [Alphaproteobacteria bacterium]